jgi:hypothetical protein
VSGVENAVHSVERDLERARRIAQDGRILTCLAAWSAS